MAFDFPASPTTGQKYTPSGGPTFTWNGTIWQVSRLGGSAPSSVRCVVARNVGQESLPVGAIGIIGTFTTNLGGWTGGATIGGSGLALIVPKAGTYMLRNRTYYNPSAGSPSGRLGITINGAGSGNFVQLPNQSAGSMTQECTTYHEFAAGDAIAYEVSVATAIVFTGTGHTGLEIVRLPDGAVY